MRVKVIHIFVFVSSRILLIQRKAIRCNRPGYFFLFFLNHGYGTNSFVEANK